MKYKYIGTEEQLINDKYFDDDLIRGGGMGWAHKVDKTTREIAWVDEEHAKARDYYSKNGGLKAYIQDLIDANLVEVIA